MSAPGKLSERYELGELIGFGGMSEVHLARDVRLHRDVAVKLLRADLARDPDCYLRFRREAQNAAALNHPAIVAVYDTGATETAGGPLPYIVMEYVDGVTLRDVVADEGPMDEDRAIEIIADVCQALETSHQHGIVHRDVKPANIMVDRTGAVKVMDFGIARTLGDDGNRLTQTAAVLGSAHYLSPEQARGEPVDARSDVYSLGCVLYELVTGTTPFVGDSPVAVAYQHVREDPVPPSRRQPTVSPAVDAVALKALAKNPDNRYQRAAEMRADLLRVQGGLAPRAPKVLPADVDAAHGPVGRSGSAHGARRGLIAVAVLVSLIIVLAVAVNAFGGRAHPVRVPDLHGQSQQEAIAALQDLGFEIGGPIERPDAQVPVGRVIGTDPGARTALAGGDTVSIDVSTGPERRAVPDCAQATVDACVRLLADAGFGHTRQSSTASATVPQNAVIATVPPAGQPLAVTEAVAIEVSSGPEVRRLPDVAGQSVDQATANVRTAGFALVLRSMVDSTLPLGAVVATDPPAGSNVSAHAAITVKVSRGNQVPMPSLMGMTYVELVPYVQGLGYTGPLLNGGDVPGPDADRNRVVAQVPPAGAAVVRTAVITVKYGS